MAASLVQTSSAGVGGYPSASTSFSSTPTVGDVVFVTGFWNPTFGTEPTGISISDNQGNTYSAVVRSAVTQENGVFIGYCVIGTASGTFTVTATVTGGSADAGVALRLQEWSGMDTASLLDQSGSGTNGVNLPGFSVSASGANSGADRVVIAGVSGRGSDITPTNSPPNTGYTSFLDLTTAGSFEPRGLASYKVVSASETSSADWGTISSGSGGSLAMVIATFKVASGGGSTQTLTPPLTTRTRTIYQPAVAPGAVTLTPPLVSRTRTIYQPAVAPGAVTLTPPLTTRTRVVYQPLVTQPGGSTQTLTPPLVSRTRTVFQPAVIPRAVTLTPPLTTRTRTVFQPLVTSSVTLTPPLTSRTRSVFQPAVAPGVVVLFPPLVTRLRTIYPPLVTGGDTPVAAANGWLPPLRRRRR